MHPNKIVEGNPTLPENVREVAGGYESSVKYYPGKTVTNAIGAVLRLEKGKILLLQKSQNNEAPKVIFSVTPREIISIDKYQTVLGFKTAQGKYKIEFSYKAGVMMGASAGLAPMGAITAAAGKQTVGKTGKNLLEQSGYHWWVGTLQNQGVKFTQPKLIKYALIALLLLMLLVILLPK